MVQADFTPLTQQDTKGSRWVEQPSWRMSEFRGVTPTWLWTGRPNSYGHGPQLARRTRRSGTPTLPLSSSEARNPRPVKAGGVMVVTTRRGSVTRLRTRPPVGEEGGCAAGAVRVEVGSHTRGGG